MRHTLNRYEILRGKKNFDNVFKHGRKAGGKILSCIYLRSKPAGNSGGGRVIFGIAVSKAVKRAVDRNRIKRLVRESYRLNKGIMTPAAAGQDHDITVLFIFSPRSSHPGPVPTYKEIEEDVIAILTSVIGSEKNLSS